MCYMNCQYETYPYGPNEGCICKRPKWVTKCPDEYEDNEIEEEYYNPEEEWACQEYDRMKEERVMENK